MTLQILTVFAFIWFFLMTVACNISFVLRVRHGEQITIKAWTVIADMLVVSFLIVRIWNWIGGAL